MSNSYLDRVEELISDKKLKKAVIAEREDHMEEKISYYTELGYSSEQAVKKAVADMGEPEQAAVPLNSLYTRKWYKSPRKIAYAIIGALLLAVVYFGGYAMSYGDRVNSMNHSIFKDVMSLLIIVVLTGFLVAAHKKKDKGPALFVLGFCIGLLVLPPIAGLFIQSRDSLNSAAVLLKYVAGVFQPVWYAAAIFVTKGASGYRDSVFANGFIKSDLKPFFVTVGYLTVVLFAVWALVVYIGIKRDERMKPAKTNTVHRIFKLVLSSVCFVSAVIMTVGTVFAIFELPNYRVKTRKMFDFVVECSETGEDFFKAAEQNGFKSEKETDSDGLFTVYAYDCVNCSLYIWFADSGNSLDYSVNWSAAPSVIGEDDIAVAKSELDDLPERKTTLGDFKKLGYYYKACSVQLGEDGSLTFEYYVRENNDYISFVFKNGILDEIIDLYGINDSSDASEEPDEEPSWNEIETIKNPLID